MIRKLLLACLLLGSVSYGQYIESAPWMDTLSKKQGTTAKGANNAFTIYEISDAFNAYWEGKDPSVKGSGFKPYKRWENYWMNYVDAQGYLPTSKELWETWKNKSISNKTPNPTSNWSFVGPDTPGTLSGSLPGTGRINQMAVDPNNPSIWYAGAPSGGLWKSVDAGNSWINLFDDFLQVGVSGIAIDPNDSNTIYITTGDDDGADSYSIGVFKSTDGGITWLETSLGPSGDSNWNFNRLMNEIVIDPANSNIVWAAGNFGLYKSIDAGLTWDLKRAGNVSDFKLKPGDGNTVYAVSNTAYYKSTNGEDFTRITDILPTSSRRLVLGVSPANPNVVYILSADSSDASYQGLYKSTDSGETFTESPNTVNIMESSQASFDLALEVAPDNANEVYMGCLNIWKSIDGGNSFTRINEWFRNTASYSHADIHTLKFFNNTLFCGSDGGLYISDDRGSTFTDKTANMGITQFYRISVASDNPDKIAGGTQDNAGYVLNNNAWNIFTGGDGMDYEINPNNNQIIYGFAQFGSPLFITTNSGQSVGQIGPPKDDQGNSIEGNWITPLAINGSGEVYAGFDTVYKLTGSSWEKTSQSFQGDNITDIEISKSNDQLIYVAREDLLYRSADGGATFNFLHRFDTFISDLAINNLDDNTVYVTTSRRVGSGVSLAAQQGLNRGVFKVVYDGTTTVENKTLNLPADQAYFSVVHQGRDINNPIYVGTSLGVYRLDDSLTEWEEYYTNMPNVAVSDLEINIEEAIITASTYGRGVWQSPIPVELADNDIRLVSLSPSNNLVLCGEIFPEITVKNNGLNPITAVDVTYNVDGGGPQPFTATVNLASEESTTIQIPSLNLTALNMHSLNVSVSITDDAFPDNNELTNTFYVNDFGLGDAINTFETADEALLTYNDDGGTPLWEKGIPGGTLLNQAGSGTQVYGTNLNGNHPDGTRAYLVSNCYETASILAPVLKFQMAYDLEINYDLVYVEYTLDDGVSWQVLGTVNSQPNWYNSDRTNASSGSDDDCQNCPGAQWTG
ncbi:MAG: hypothetical protein KJO53_00020, partial [Eudoraea sp.]|nr:hypothetical protein [Eudoraea sp.]